MAHQSRILISAALFLSFLAPGTSALDAAESLSAQPQASPTGVLELAAIPHDLETGPSSVQREIDGAGSEDGVGLLGAPDSPDPWAEAFAESSRLQTMQAPDSPLVVNGQVRYFVDRFTGSRRDVVSLWMSRSTRYLAMIRDTLKTRGLPEDLAWVAMVESGFNSAAVSRAGAKGLWQFMAATARRYGLRVDAWIDERLDPEKSTLAAAAYLRDLYTLFGSWELAWAAYNAGEVTVARAIRVTGSTDFWALARTRHLRRETKDFVPQIHAARLIGRDPEGYGFEFAWAEAAPVETVLVPPATDLRRLASASGLSPAALRGLNPVLVRGVTPPGGRFALKVPAGARVAVLAALEPTRPAKTAVAQARASGTARAAASAQVHIVRPRDTIGAIAKRYGVSVGDVLRWNGLESNGTIRPGDQLRVDALRPSAERDGQGGFR